MPDAKGSIREIILPKGLDLDRPKRTRTSFTAEQLYRLEMEFQRCQYVVGRERTELARQLNLSETQVAPERRGALAALPCPALLRGTPFPARPSPCPAGPKGAALRASCAPQRSPRGARQPPRCPRVSGRGDGDEGPVAEASRRGTP